MKSAKNLITAAQQVAEHMVRDLEKLTWIETLPGMKVLSQHYGVSHQTVNSAMQYLEQWGWIEPPEPRKSRKIIQQTSSPDKKVTKNLLILHPEETVDADNSIFLRNQLAHGWRNKYDRSFIIPVPKIEDKSIENELNSLIHKYGADALVLNNLSVLWGYAALDSTLPTYFCGGGLPPRGSEKRCLVNGFCASFPKEISKAYTMLRKLGHKRILFVSSDFGLDAKEIIVSLPESPKATDNLIGLPADYCVQVNSSEPSAWLQMWQREVPLRKPTAIVTVNACSIPSFYSYCQLAGKSIPADYSIMSLEYVKELEYLLPRPLMAQYDFQGHCDHFESWVNGELKHIGLHFSGYEWDILGESLGQATQ